MNSNTIIKDSQDGYTLSDNRFAVRKVKPEYSCEEFGKVIVRVWVNKEGFTIKAEAGIRGTTESSPCLLKEAKNAAMKTTWTPYFNAPEVQIGHITYNFHKY
jgi:protein TonB